MESIEKGEKYRLSCGHEGRVIWVDEHQKVIGVGGTRRSCGTCGKKTSGNWSPNVYLIQLS